MSGTISTEQALSYTMVTMSGVEGKINAVELAEIRQLVQTLRSRGDMSFEVLRCCAAL